MADYLTVLKEGFSDLTIERSQFLGYVKNVTSREEAEAFFSSVKAAHRDARHHVPAFVLGPGGREQWASDDGEPQGTAGAPVLGLLAAEGLTNVALIVVRYFGGIKLGTGGLVRAYTQAAREALTDAGRAQAVGGAVLTFQLPYAALDKVKHFAAAEGYEIRDTEYAEAVKLFILTEDAREGALTERITNITAGEARLLAREETEILRSPG